MTLLTIAPLPTVDIQSADPDPNPKARRVAKRLVGIAKEYTVRSFRAAHGRDPVKMPTNALAGLPLTQHEYARAQVANADANEYNALMREAMAVVANFWRDSHIWSPSSRIEGLLQWVERKVANLDPLGMA